MSPEQEERYIEYSVKVWGRIEAGARTYEDRSFSKDPVELLRELQQEALDLAGWGFVLWSRLRALESAAESVLSQSVTPEILVRRPTRPVEPAHPTEPDMTPVSAPTKRDEEPKQ